MRFICAYCMDKGENMKKNSIEFIVDFDLHIFFMQL